MYEAKKEYQEYKTKDEMKDYLPEWLRILQDYFRRNYYSSSVKSDAKKARK